MTNNKSISIGTTRGHNRENQTAIYKQRSNAAGYTSERCREESQSDADASPAVYEEADGETAALDRLEAAIEANEVVAVVLEPTHLPTGRLAAWGDRAVFGPPIFNGDGKLKRLDFAVELQSRFLHRREHDE